MCSLKEGIPETAEVAFLKGTRSWWSAFTLHAGPWGAHTEKGRQRVPPALPLLICLLRTGSLLLSLQIKWLIQGQKGSGEAAVFGHHQTPGAWSSHWEVCVEQSCRPPQPDRLGALRLCQGQGPEPQATG